MLGPLSLVLRQRLLLLGRVKEIGYNQCSRDVRGRLGIPMRARVPVRDQARVLGGLQAGENLPVLYAGKG